MRATRAQFARRKKLYNLGVFRIYMDGAGLWHVEKKGWFFWRKWGARYGYFNAADARDAVRSHRNAIVSKIEYAKARKKRFNEEPL